ncbi:MULTISPECIES: TIGR01906 family membrane protein [unclassified Enterococcus]|uniref:TIGR01906 family membrane protein n=1 Tax=unclassified Enterococcus TaxID=2608891 RepID=UPI00201B3E2F|nr:MULTISPECIES: TIGR01906 family membrane protein [unclassified Enterococcus]
MKHKLGLICLILTMISFAVIIPIYSKWLYLIDLNFYDLDQAAGLSKQVISHNYDILMQYLLNPFKEKLSMPDFPSSKDGLKHFHDVKLLFQLVQVVFLVTIVPSFLFLRRLKRQEQLWRLINPMRFMMLLPIGLGFLMFLGFDTFFTKFHELFFSDSTWIFYPEVDPIILVLPEEYFMHCFILGFAVLELLAFCFYWRGKRSL